MQDSLHLPLELEVDGRPAGLDTVAGRSGPRSLVLRSCSAQLGVMLTGAYVGHEVLDELAVAEVVDLGRDDVATRTRVVRAPTGALVYARRAALYDHLQRLQELAGAGAAVLGVDAAVAALDPLAV